MPRPQAAVIFAVIFSSAWIVADSRSADAQLFRRLQTWRQSRQNAPPVQRPTQQPAARNPGNYSQPGVQGRYPYPGRPATGQPRASVPVQRTPQQPRRTARYAQPAAGGVNRGMIVRSGVVPASGVMPSLESLGKPIVLNGAQSPTPAGSIKPASNEASDQSEVKPQDVDEEKFGTSILSGKNDTKTESGKNSEEDDASSSDTYASMGVDVFQSSVDGTFGVRVARIRDDSMAIKAGLRVDDVIVAIDEARTRSVADIASQLRKHKVGERVGVEFVRGRQRYLTAFPLIARSAKPVVKDIAVQDKEISKTPGSADENKGDKPSESVASAKPVVGAEGKEMEKAASGSPSGTGRVKLGLLIQDAGGLRGTTVTSVRENTPADAAGIQRGDRIVSVDGRMLANGDALRQEVVQRKADDQLKLGIVRDGKLLAKTLSLSAPTTDLANKPKSGSSNDSGGLASGLGSMIGGFFKGPASTEQEPSNQESAKAAQPKVAPQPIATVNYQDEPEPEPVAKVLETDGDDQAISFEDEMDFGDGEPIEQTIFTSPRSTKTTKNGTGKKRSLPSDPQSLEALPSPKP